MVIMKNRNNVWMTLLFSLLLITSACAYKKQSWGNCPVKDRAKIIRITNGSKPDKEVITVKLESTKQEFTYPEYSKSANGMNLKVGDYFCTEEDYD